MLKPYPQRVKATYELMECFIRFVSQHSEQIKQLREQTKQTVLSQQSPYPGVETGYEQAQYHHF